MNHKCHPKWEFCFFIYFKGQAYVSSQVLHLETFASLPHCVYCDNSKRKYRESSKSFFCLLNEFLDLEVWGFMLMAIYLPVVGIYTCPEPHLGTEHA